MDYTKRDVFCAYLTNRTHYVGKYDLPEVSCYIDEYPDYICIYPEKQNYHKTKNTAVGFFVDDYKFDSTDGLYYAIKTRNKVLLKKYKERFENCKYVIAPDFSMYSDMPLYQQIENLAHSRIVFLWLLLECKVTAIPFAGWGSLETLDFCFDGIEEGSTVAISLKGPMDNREEKELARKAINKLIENVQPKAIIVYAVCSNEALDEFFSSIKHDGIDIVIPSNILKNRNDIHKKARQEQSLIEQTI